MHFDGGELLHIWNPGNPTFQGQQFVIGSAARVLWQWYYYGRPRTPENLYFEDYLVRSDGVEAKSSADW